MISTKYGAMERYFGFAAHHCREMGLRTVLQYETLPPIKAYLDDVKRSGSEMVVRAVNKGKVRGVGNIIRLIADVRPAIVHAHFVSDHGRLAIPIISRVFGVKRVIVMVHNNPEWTRKKLGAAAYNLYDSVLCVSNAVRHALTIGGVAERKLHTHYLGLIGPRDPSCALKKEMRNRFCLNDDDVVLGSIAFDAPFKGLDILIRSMALLSGDAKKVHLLQVGVDPERSTLPSLARQMGVSDRIHWAGIVDNGWLFLNAADIYIQPSRFGEGLPLAIMEAMAMKLPVVCTNVSGNVEAVGSHENGLIVTPSPQDLAQGIRWMLEHREVWRSFGEAGHEKYLKLFDGQASIRNMVRNYYIAPIEGPSCDGQGT